MNDARGASFSTSSAATVRIALVTIYGIAMAYFEAAAVIYMRTLYGGQDPARRSAPLTIIDYRGVELVREAATLVMLACVGWLAGRSWGERVAYFFIAFGVWDLGYYVWLRWLVGWPKGVLDWDVLFGIPLPWWAPVLAPILIATLMVGAGATWAWRLAKDVTPRNPREAWLLMLAGAMPVLAAFMLDSLEQLLRGNRAAALLVTPTSFSWPLFLVGLTFMLVGILRLNRRS